MLLKCSSAELEHSVRADRIFHISQELIAGGFGEVGQIVKDHGSPFEASLAQGIAEIFIDRGAFDTFCTALTHDV